MITLNEIRDAIVATLQGVPGIGKVHGRRRNLRQERDLKEQAVHDGKVNVWMVSRSSTTETSPDLGTGVIDHTWEIRGFLQFDDSTGGELVMDALVEAIRTAFRASEDLGIAGLTTVTPERAGVQVVDTQPATLGNVICAACRLSLTTRHLD